MTLQLICSRSRLLMTPVRAKIQSEDTEGNQGHRIGVDTRKSVRQPEKDSNDERYDDHIRLEVLLHSTIDFQFYCLLREGEELQK